METPLSPLDFARRARRLYGEREAVIDGERRFTYRQFFERCDRWSNALQGFGNRVPGYKFRNNDRKKPHRRNPSIPVPRPA